MIVIYVIYIVYKSIRNRLLFDLNIVKINIVFIIWNILISFNLCLIFINSGINMMFDNNEIKFVIILKLLSLFVRNFKLLK